MDTNENQIKSSSPAKMMALFLIVHIFCLLYLFVYSHDAFFSFIKLFLVLLAFSLALLGLVSITHKKYSFAMIMLLLQEIGAMFQCIIAPSSSSSLIPVIIIGGVLGIIFVLFHRFLYPLRFVKYIYGPLMLLVFVGLNIWLYKYGIEINGAKLWVEIRGIRFQLTDVMKLVLLLYFAHIFSNERMSEQSKFIHMEIVIGISACVFAVYNELGTLLVLILTYTMACFVFLKKRYALLNLFIMIALLLIGSMCIIFIVNKCTSWITMGPIFNKIYNIAYKCYERVLTVIDPMSGAATYAFQVLQGKKAIMIGGLWGSDVPFEMPNMASDSALAILILRCGFIMGSIIVSLYAACGIGGALHLSRNVDGKSFYPYLNLIFIIAFTIQAFYSVLACFGVLPLTGIPFPFLSAGGSAQVIFIIYFFSMIFLDQKIEDTIDEDEEEQEIIDGAIEETKLNEFDIPFVE